MPELPRADQILNSLSDAILIIDQDNLIGAVNPAAENLFRNSAKKLVSQSLDSILSFKNQRLSQILFDGHTKLSAHDVTANLRGRSLKVDFSIENISASPIWRVLSLKAKPERLGCDDGDGGGTNQIGAGAPNVLGHEIKNPLAAIRGAAQLLSRSCDVDGKQHTCMIISEVDRIASLMERMQSLSANQSTNVRPLNIHEIINQARTRIETATNNPITISDNFDPSLPDVLADPDAMLQVLSNLLSNAADASRLRDDPRIMIITRFSFGGAISTKDNERPIKLPIEVVIEDNGPGVPEDVKENIFSPFVTTKPHGQGLGLALAKKLIEDMHGHVKHERDSETQVTRFTLFLPKAREA